MQLPCVFGNLVTRLSLGGDAGVEFLRDVIVAFETHGFVKFFCRPLLPCRGFEWSASVGTASKMFAVAPANIRLLLACRGFALLVVVTPHLFVGLFHDCLPFRECFGFILCVHSGSSISNLNGQKKSGFLFFDGVPFGCGPCSWLAAHGQNIAILGVSRFELTISNYWPLDRLSGEAPDFSAKDPLVSLFLRASCHDARRTPSPGAYDLLLLALHSRQVSLNCAVVHEELPQP